MKYEKYPNKKVSTEEIGKMADFLLKNSLFEFDSKFQKQMLGTACTFMDHIETELLKMQDIKPWFWKKFINVIFLYGLKVKRV